MDGRIKLKEVVDMNAKAYLYGNGLDKKTDKFLTYLTQISWAISVNIEAFKFIHEPKEVKIKFLLRYPTTEPDLRDYYTITIDYSQIYELFDKIRYKLMTKDPDITIYAYGDIKLTDIKKIKLDSHIALYKPNLPSYYLYELYITAYADGAVFYPIDEDQTIYIREQKTTDINLQVVNLHAVNTLL